MSADYPIAPAKPCKPYPDFPLFAHATRRWAKKIRGKMHYFGPWADPIGSLNKYLKDRDDLHAGRTPRADGFTVADLANRFLTSKKHKLDAGEMTPASFHRFHSACELAVKVLGKNRLAEDVRPD